MNQPESPHQIDPPPAQSVGTLIVRYGLGAVMVIAGIVLLIVSPAGLGFDGFALAVGGGLSVVLFNVLFRLGLSSEADRLEEERARDYFDEHGEWPEEPPRQGRVWTLPVGVVTYEQEQARLAARDAAARDGAARDTGAAARDAAARAA